MNMSSALVLHFLPSGELTDDSIEEILESIDAQLTELMENGDQLGGVIIAADPSGALAQCADLISEAIPRGLAAIGADVPDKSELN